MIRHAGAFWAETRRPWRRIALFRGLQCLAVGLLASSTSPACAQQQTDYTMQRQTGFTIKQLLSTTTTSAGQKIVLPKKDAELVASIFEIRPGARLPEHEHPYPRYGYILSGSLRVTDTETGQSKTIGQETSFWRRWDGGIPAPTQERSRQGCSLSTSYRTETPTPCCASRGAVDKAELCRWLFVPYVNGKSSKRWKRRDDWGVNSEWHSSPFTYVWSENETWCHHGI